MKYRINQLYNNNLNKKEPIEENILLTHQKQNQRSGVEQKKGLISRRKREKRERIERNTTMAEIINKARRNIAEGKIIEVG